MPDIQPVKGTLSQLALRRMSNVDPAGVVLGLDNVRGIVLARWYSVGDHGEVGHMLPKGEEVVFVATVGDPREVFDFFRDKGPHGILVVPVVRHPTRRDRLDSWLRWRQWQRNTRAVQRSTLQREKKRKE